jgi:BirA family biotin operon repressor/biotin-[acetyl-CoA-carboxylase] ligase
VSVKLDVLALLERGRGEHISGGAMARALSVSRSAVWKAVEELRRDGYAIEAVTRSGYRLPPDSDILSVQGMLPFLSPGVEAGRIFVHGAVDSTNTIAKELALGGAAHGTAVLADSQTAGRGRCGRAFHSPPGRGLYLSVLLRPERLWFRELTLLTAFAAVAVCETVEALSGRQARVKWVNDVFVDGRKVCGILTEAVFDVESGQVQWAVLGVGVNLRAAAEDFPENIRHTAGSVFPEGGPSVTRSRFAAELLNRLLAPEPVPDAQTLVASYRRRLIDCELDMQKGLTMTPPMLYTADSSNQGGE